MSSSARHSRYAGIGAGRHVGHSITDDIDALIGDYHAWQTESEARERGRRGSAGTLVVDWDGTGMGQAFYRGRNSSPARLAEGSTAPSSNASQAKSSKASRAQFTPPSHVPHSTTSRAPSSKAPRTQPTYTASTIASSAKSKQPKPKAKVDSLFGPVISTVHHRYTDTEHFRPKARPRSDSTDVNFHRHPHVYAYEQADISVAYSPTTNTARGHDAATQLNYAYNGKTMHVHEQVGQHTQQRPGAAAHTPPINAYFSVPVEKYRPNTHTPSNGTASSSSAHIKHRQHKSLPPLPSHQKRIARSFVKRVLSKLDSSGVLGRMRKEREERRKTEAWVREGHFT